MVNESDRQRILERRALFVGSSLAFLACGPKPPPDPPAGPGPDVVQVNNPEPRPGASASASASAPVVVASALPPRKSRPSPGDLPADLSFETPAGLSERGQKNYERLSSFVRAQLETIEAAEQKIPRPCDVGSADCEAAFREVALQLLDYDQGRRFSYFCPGSSAEAKDFAAVERRVKDRITERYSELTRKIVAAMSSGTTSPDKAWESLLQRARASRPMPCLSFACADW